jgi:hypothetical protein
MLQQTQIRNLLAKYGNVSAIGGSYLYDLMIYPDLDLSIIAPLVDNDLASRLVTVLIKNEFVRSVNCVDTYHFGHATKSGRPDGYWLGIEIPFENERWGIDCWVQQPDWVKKDLNNDKYAHSLSELNQKEKDSVLQLKYQLIYRGLYGSQYYSNQIYDAVIKNGPLSIDQFFSLSK